MRAAKVQASLRIRAVSPEPSLLAHISSESRGTFRQKARSLAPLNGWACAVEICHDGMLEDTNSLDGAHLSSLIYSLEDLGALLKEALLFDKFAVFYFHYLYIEIFSKKEEKKRKRKEVAPKYQYSSNKTVLGMASIFFRNFCHRMWQSAAMILSFQTDRSRQTVYT